MAPPPDDTRGGFDFDNVRRNASLEARGMVAPKAWKTGTTIAGIVFRDGVVLGADTRSTNGDTVADKNCEKIHYIAPNIYCCGAGTAADTENVTAMVSSALELHRFATSRQSRVITALTLLKQHLFGYQGHISAALVLGGVDFNGPHLFTVRADLIAPAPGWLSPSVPLLPPSVSHRHALTPPFLPPPMRWSSGVPARLHGRAPLRDHGLRLAGGHGRV